MCENAWHAANYQQNPKVKAKNAAWAKANQHKRRAWQQRDMRENPEKWRKRRLKHSFGLTLEQFNEMFVAQGGCCAICARHQSEVGKTLCVDHNHATGRIRKLLCSGCNHALGLLREDQAAVRAMLDYIQEDQN